ncbi:MAG: hypothetical protein IT369_11095 [Candidatus Latescibacteria bacterium]|nr:hypothetical protein [Candidatus Latescibacterota bacterium]
MDREEMARIDGLLRARQNPRCLRLGLGGGSGSGKSTVAALIRQQLEPLTTEVITLDRFFKPADQLPRYYAARLGSLQPDYNQPDSLQVAEMVAHCRQYPATDVHLLDGHFSLHYPELRQLMDLRLFVAADLERMLERRTARNLAAGYGGSHEHILSYNRECVVPGYLGYIEPSRRFADLEIPNNEADTAARDRLLADLCTRIRQALQAAS